MGGGGALDRQRGGGTHPGNGSTERRWKTVARAWFQRGGGLPRWPVVGEGGGEARSRVKMKGGWRRRAHRAGWGRPLKVGDVGERGGGSGSIVRGVAEGDGA
jgi:hypothetical protein